MSIQENKRSAKRSTAGTCGSSSGDGGFRRGVLRSLGLAVGVLAWSAVVATTVESSHSPSDVSEGVYRIPYQNGTEVRVTRDHHDHSPVQDRIDMIGINGAEPYRVVAAADGTIRFIQDDNTQEGGDCDFNNYVWIEHPNGEWTKYSHLSTDSVNGDAGLNVGDFVTLGTFLGFEDDIGCASGEHLHWEVAVPDDPANPITPLGGFIIGENRVPFICDIPNNVFVTGEEYTAADCVSVPAPGICSLVPAPGPGAIMASPGVLTVGTAGPDVIYGTSGADHIAGLGGNDIVFGLAGEDQLSGGDGDDTICAGADRDLVSGGVGNDIISGGGGNDDLAEGPGSGEVHGWFGADRLSGGDGIDGCFPGGDPGDAVAGCE